ncbi:MAG: GtrA family protein [bacterium]
MIKKLFDITFWKFILVGVINTLVGTAVMFGCYNLLHLSYWVSSAANYIVGSVVSYFLNKNFTFQNKSKDPMVVVRFVLSITVCYLLAYGIAKPLVRQILSSASVSVQENGAMLVGMCLFVGLNYLGQRFFAFREKEEKEA